MNQPCEVCGKPATQLGHRLPQTRHNLTIYGEKVIHHTRNMAHVCDLKCNSAVSISNHPLAQARLLAAIYDDLARKERERIGEP